MSRIQKYNNWLIAIGGTILLLLFCFAVFEVVTDFSSLSRVLRQNQYVNNRDYMDARSYPDPDSIVYQVYFSAPVAIDSPASVFALGIQRAPLYDPEAAHESYADHTSVIPGWHYSIGYNYANILIYNKQNDTRQFVFDHPMEIDNYRTGTFQNKAYVLIIASEKREGNKQPVNSFFIYRVSENSLKEIKDSANVYDMEIITASGDIAITYVDHDFNTQSVKLYSMQNDTTYDIIDDAVRNTVSQYAD